MDTDVSICGNMVHCSHTHTLGGLAVILEDVAMADLPAIKQLPVMAPSEKAHR